MRWGHIRLTLLIPAGRPARGEMESFQRQSGGAGWRPEQMGHQGGEKSCNQLLSAAQADEEPPGGEEERRRRGGGAQLPQAGGEHARRLMLAKRSSFQLKHHYSPGGLYERGHTPAFLMRLDSRGHARTGREDEKRTRKTTSEPGRV